MTQRRSLIGQFWDTVGDVTHQTIFILRSILAPVGPSLSLWVAISLNYDRYWPGLKLGWTNVRFSCQDLSVGRQNPGNSWFWRTDWAAELAKCSSDRSRSRRNGSLAGTRPYPSSGHHERWQPRYLFNFLCFWLWNSLKIMLRTGLYHMINTEPDAHCILEVVLAGRSYGRVPLEAFGLSRYLSVWPAGQYDHVCDAHLVLSMCCFVKHFYKFYPMVIWVIWHGDFIQH